MSIIVQNVHVHLVDQGTGLPTLLLHGNPDTADLWHGVIAHLQPLYRCLAPDLPGFGRSIAPHDFDCSLANMAQFVDDLLTAIPITAPINLVVHDFGAIFGLAWAVKHPTTVRRLVIMNSIFFPDYQWHIWARIWRTPLIGEISMLIANRWIFAWVLRRGSRRLTAEHICRTYASVTPASKSMVLRLYRTTDPENFRGWEDQLLALAAQTPTCVLWGEQDPYIAKRFAERFGAQEVIYFSESGHWLPAEMPDAVAQKLQTFLA